MTNKSYSLRLSQTPKMTNSDVDDSNERGQAYSLTTMKSKKNRALKVDITSDVNAGRISTLTATEGETSELRAMAHSDLVQDKKNLQDAKAKEEAIKVSFNSTPFFFNCRVLINAQELIKRFEAYHAGQVRLDKNNPVDQQIGMRLICQ